MNLKIFFKNNNIKIIANNEILADNKYVNNLFTVWKINNNYN